MKRRSVFKLVAGALASLFVMPVAEKTVDVSFKLVSPIKVCKNITFSDGTCWATIKIDGPPRYEITGLAEHGIADGSIVSVDRNSGNLVVHCNKSKV